MNKTVSRELQETQLRFADTFLSQVNRTYAFPQSLDTDCAVGTEVAVGVSYLQVEAIDTEIGFLSLRVPFDRSTSVFSHRWSSLQVMPI
jgi:hypothetical protein